MKIQGEHKITYHKLEWVVIMVSVKDNHPIKTKNLLKEEQYKLQNQYNLRTNQILIALR